MTAPDGADEQPIELLDGSRAVTETQITAGPNPARGLVVGLFAVLAIAVLAWSLVGGRSGSEETGDDPASPSVDREDGSRSQTTVPRQTTTTSAPTTGPLLGARTGLWLFYGGEDPLQRLDLDNGEIDRYGLRAWPLAGIGDKLVVTAEGSGSIGWVPLDNPGEQALAWTEATAAGGDDPGHLWLLTADPPTWSLIEVGVNRTIEQRVVPEQVAAAQRSGPRQRHLLPDPDLVDTPNGIYEFDGTEYRRVGEGRVHHFDDDRALVERCGATIDDCTLQWFDRATWQPVDLAVPTAPIESARVLGDGSTVRSVRPGGASSELTSLETGDRIELVGRGESVVVSPDGRWLAFTTPDVGLSLVDLGTGSIVHEIEVFTRSRPGSLLFVEK